MQVKAVFLASILLVGCQAFQQNNSNNIIKKSARCVLMAEFGKKATRKFTNSTNRIKHKASFFIQTQNLWSSIIRELKMKIPDNRLILEQKQRYLRNKSCLHDIISRAEPYAYWISGEIKKRHMPMELVLIPMVESAFDPYATSVANAAGIWQIIPSTGRNYGLRQNNSYDARRDLVASTTAALNILQRLNKTFRGNWLLTIAAYNSGEGRVLKAIKENKLRGKPTDFWSLLLPKETKTYVPKMLALSDILKHSKRYGVQLPSTNKNRALECVRLNNPVNIKQIAKMAGMTTSQLEIFNAGITKGTTFGTNAPQYVLLPQKYANQLRESLLTDKINAV